MTSRIHVTVVLLKPFWKTARESLLILFHPKRDSLSALNIYMLLFNGLLKDTYFSLHIPRSKTDQYGSGSTRVVARTGNPTCPFNMLHRYAQLSGDSFDSTEFVFRSLSKGKSGIYSLRAGFKLS